MGGPDIVNAGGPFFITWSGGPITLPGGPIGWVGLGGPMLRPLAGGPNVLILLAIVFSSSIYELTIVIFKWLWEDRLCQQADLSAVQVAHK